jgi:hypothetical protein
VNELLNMYSLVTFWKQSNYPKIYSGRSPPKCMEQIHQVILDHPQENLIKQLKIHPAWVPYYVLF